MDQEDEYRALVARLWPRLVRTARLLGSNSQDAEDQAQVALIQAYRSWDRVRSVASVDAYVYRILINSRTTGLRRRWHSEVPVEVVDDVHVADPTDAVDLADLLVSALQRLPIKHRQVVVLRYYVDLTEPQIADALDLPVGTVKSRLHRAQAQLQADPTLTPTLERKTS